MQTIANLFEKHHMFRRLVLIFQLFAVIYVTELSYKYVLQAMDHSISGVDVVMVMGALQAPITALMAYSFKVYSNQRSLDAKPK